MGVIVLKNSTMDADGCGGTERVSGVIGTPLRLGREDCLRSGDEFGQLGQVLGDGGEVEFVAGAARPAQP